jgi:hypothetical protein
MALKRFIVEMDDSMAIMLKNSGQIRIVENATLTEASLASVKISDIDLQSAAEHFDLPYGDQFASKRALMSGLRETQKQFVGLFGRQSRLMIFRGMDVDPDWATKLQPGDELGVSWAWQAEGAHRFMTGSNPVLLQGEININDVNWELTIAVNTFRPDEMEIVLEPRAEITLISVTNAKNQQLLANDLRGSEFYP